jgi:hypothetical protein
VPAVTPRGKPGNVGTAVATPAFTPTPAQQWMWEAVVLPVKPVKVTFTVIILPSMVTTAKPLPREEFAGTSFVPLSVVVNTIGAAVATPESAQKVSAKARRLSVLLIIKPPSQIERLVRTAAWQATGSMSGGVTIR